MLFESFTFRALLLNNKINPDFSLALAMFRSLNQSMNQFVYWIHTCITMHIIIQKSLEQEHLLFFTYMYNYRCRAHRRVTQQTQNICIACLQCWTNVKVVRPGCTNVIQMFCACWVGYAYDMQHIIFKIKFKRVVRHHSLSTCCRSTQCSKDSERSGPSQGN